MDELQTEIEELNRNKIAKRHINEFDVYDVLGSGAFGSVYRVSLFTIESSYYGNLMLLNLTDVDR